MSFYPNTTKPDEDTINHQDVDSQGTDSQDVDSQDIDTQSVDSQFTVAKGPVASPPISTSTLLQLPPDLSLIRQQLFRLDTQVTWTADELAQYWPYVDNIWVHNCTRPMTKKKIQKSY